MKIEIELPEEALLLALRTALSNAFNGRSGYNDVGAGYAEVARQVRIAVEAMDYTDIIREEAKRMSRGIVEECVQTELKRMVRETVKRERDQGTLLSVEITS